jgi:hypothetical protein
MAGRHDPEQGRMRILANCHAGHLRLEEPAPLSVPQAEIKIFQDSYQMFAEFIELGAIFA